MKKARIIIVILVLLGAASLAEAQIVVSQTTASTTRFHEKSGREKGLVIRPEILATHDVNHPEGNLINFHATVAYQFNPYYSIGGGLGVDNLQSVFSGSKALPLHRPKNRLPVFTQQWHHQ